MKASQSNLVKRQGQGQGLVLEIVVSFDDIQYTLRLDEKSSIADMKKQIQQYIGVKQQDQILKDSNKKFIVDEEARLSSLNNKKQLKFFLIQSEKRLFQFNKLNPRKVGTSSVGYSSNADQSPYLIQPGLILRAYCRNKECSAIDKLVCVNKGFSDKFNLGKQIHLSYCRLCGKKTDKPKSLGYYKCRIQIQGAHQDGEQYKYQDQARGHQYKSFNDYGDQQQTKWSYLQVKTEALQ